MRISFYNLKCLSSIRIYKGADNQYYIEVEGLYNDDTKAKGFVDPWETLEEALICARGISKMFDLDLALIQVESLSGHEDREDGGVPASLSPGAK
ncbi:hypothetical protein [Paenibacillus hamazuiensis]|uniref:hypothetical protein n=1 Tax=Paenibacillus hamazuiensis TaxID=2936508 RepID=UPI00200D23DD|nr:hypothetical protein [Paenibacillus hamazuiensis]